MSIYISLRLQSFITSRTHAIHRDIIVFNLYNNYIVHDVESSTNLEDLLPETACIA